jgi:preprotein translocase subunit Sec63
MDPYEVLGLSQDDRPAPEAIRKAYHKLARVHHPDKAHTPEDRERAEAGLDTIASDTTFTHTHSLVNWAGKRESQALSSLPT